MKIIKKNHYTLLACLLSLTPATAQPEPISEPQLNITPDKLAQTDQATNAKSSAFEQYFLFGKTGSGKRLYQQLLTKQHASLSQLKSRQDLILTLVETPMFLEEIRPILASITQIDLILAAVGSLLNISKEGISSQSNDKITQIISLKAQCAYALKAYLASNPKISELYEAATIVDQQLMRLDFSKKESHDALAEDISAKLLVYFDFIAEIDVYVNIAEAICNARSAQTESPTAQQPTYCFVKFDENTETSSFNARNIWVQEGTTLARLPEISSSRPKTSDATPQHLIPVSLPATTVLDRASLNNATAMLQANVLLATQFGVALAEHVDLSPLTQFALELSIETVNKEPQTI